MLRHLIEDVEAPADAQCNSFHHVPNISYLEICQFINSTDSCRPDDGFVDYLSFIYCTLSGSSQRMLFGYTYGFGKKSHLRESAKFLYERYERLFHF